MIAALRELGLQIEVRYKVNARKIRRALKRGDGIIIVGFAFGKGGDEGHWFFLESMDGDIFRAVNYRSGEAVSEVHREELMSDLRKRGHGVDKPTALIIKRS
jgi:hypothetical protein